MSEKNKDICRRELELLNQRKLELFEQLYHPDFRQFGPGNPEGEDLNAYLESWKRNFASFPDFHAEMVDMIAEGDKVAVVWRLQGTFTGDMGNIPANNKQISWSGIYINRIMDGKIVESITAFDILGPAVEMGGYQAVVPAAG